jgi:hypothetical protein
VYKNVLAESFVRASSVFYNEENFGSVIFAIFDKIFGYFLTN